MMMRNMRRRSVLSVVIVGFAMLVPAWSAPLQAQLSSAQDPILKWNAIALQAVADDHSGTFGEPNQKGPTRTARALAIMHIAAYDAVNTIVGGYEPYLAVSVLPKATIKKASLNAAVAQAAHDTLVVLYPRQASVFLRALLLDLKGVPLNKGRIEGILVGKIAALNILIARINDGSNTPDVAFPVGPSVIGIHQPDPLNPNQGLHVPRWGEVTPFAIDSVENFHAPAPPQPDSDNEVERMAYALAYDEVLRLGGDGIITPTQRTVEQSEIGVFWAYDGAIGLGTPPRLYNQIARTIAMQERNTVAQNARLFALLNIAQADAGIACWYTKYQYNFWRPIIGIRSGDYDDNEFTDGDPSWMALGAPATNRSNGGINFTPPFPAYTSGHATFGAAAFQTLAHLYGDRYNFQFTSDEFNGRNTDSQGRVRPIRIRRFTSFSQASAENARSRVYLGVHWQFDADMGVAIGNEVADHVFEEYLSPVSR